MFKFFLLKKKIIINFFLQKEFIGKNALLKQLKNGILKRFVQILIDKHKMDSDPWPQGGEPLFCNNKLAGWTTSSAYAFTLGNHVI